MEYSSTCSGFGSPCACYILIFESTVWSYLFGDLIEKQNQLLPGSQKPNWVLKPESQNCDTNVHVSELHVSFSKTLKQADTEDT